MYSAHSNSTKGQCFQECSRLKNDQECWNFIKVLASPTFISSHCLISWQLMLGLYADHQIFHWAVILQSWNQFLKVLGYSFLLCLWLPIASPRISHLIFRYFFEDWHKKVKVQRVTIKSSQWDSSDLFHAITSPFLLYETRLLYPFYLEDHWYLYTEPFVNFW